MQETLTKSAQCFWPNRQSSHCFWNYAIHALSSLIKRLCCWLFRKATRGQVKQHLIQGAKSWRNSVLFQQTGGCDIFSHVRLNIDVKRNVSQHIYLKVKFRTQFFKAIIHGRCSEKFLSSESKNFSHWLKQNKIAPSQVTCNFSYHFGIEQNCKLRNKPQHHGDLQTTGYRCF